MVKGQVQMTETIGIVIVFSILIVFALLFFSRIQQNSADQQRTLVAGEKAVSISFSALFLPELECSKIGSDDIKDCIDVLKLTPAADVINENPQYYFKLFGYSTISIEEIYPVQDPTHTWVLYSRTRDGQPPTEFTQRARTPIPVALYNPVTGDYAFGVMTIDAY